MSSDTMAGLHHPVPQHTRDSDPSDEGNHRSSQRTSLHRASTNPSAPTSPAPVRPSYRRMTWNGPSSDVERSSDTQSQGTTIEAGLQRAKIIPSVLGNPEVPVGEAPGFWQQLRNIIYGTWANWLLLAIPISWILHFVTPEQHTLVLLFSSLAIIPLSRLLGFCTEELSMRTGEALAGLLHTTLGNAVELIFSILALVKCELRVVQSSLIGSILSNLLLVLGFCFFVGGTRFSEQGFVASASQLNSSLLTLSVIGVLIPAAFDMVAGNGRISGFDNETEQRGILKLSRVTAVVLLFIYVSYLYFQFFSHKGLYDDKIGSKPETVQYPPRDGPGVAGAVKDTAKNSFPLRSRKDDAERQTEHGEEEESPKLSMIMAVAVLVVVTVLIAVTAVWLVDSINGLASGGKISKGFIGLILVPIIYSPATLTAAVADSMKDRLTSSLGVAAGSSIQIALFVIPFMIILGWIIGRPITMLFDQLESIVLFLTILAVNYVVQDGKSNWLEGMILICLYVIVATVFWFYPGTEPTGILTCPA